MDHEQQPQQRHHLPHQSLSLVRRRRRLFHFIVIIGCLSVLVITGLSSSTQSSFFFLPNTTNYSWNNANDNNIDPSVDATIPRVTEGWYWNTDNNDRNQHHHHHHLVNNTTTMTPATTTTATTTTTTTAENDNSIEGDKTTMTNLPPTATTAPATNDPSSASSSSSTTTTTTTTTTTISRIQSDISEENADTNGDHQRHHHQRLVENRTCAINLYGLPRAFRQSVLPSLVVNVLQINQHYHCDYYIHSYNKSSEPAGRSGKGGSIYPHDVLLLEDALHMIYNISSSSTTNNNNNNNNHHRDDLPIFMAEFDTDDDFESYRQKELYEMVTQWTLPKNSIDIIRESKGKIYNPYLFRHFDTATFRNILKMWHGQERVWDLMERGWKTKQRRRIRKIQQQQQQQEEEMTMSNNSNNNSVDHYDRVMMLRLDVVYTTPIDIWKVRKGYKLKGLHARRDRHGHMILDNDLTTYEHAARIFNVTTSSSDNDVNDNNGQQQVVPPNQDVATGAVTMDENEYFIDYYNEHGMIPGFGMYPVNDRMFVGPYEATKVWASERFSRAKSHVLNTTRIDPMTNTTIVVPAKVELGDGIHDERFLAYTIFPAMTQEHNVKIHIDPDLWFMRARADGSIWILDTPRLSRHEARIGDRVLDAEKQNLDSIFSRYYTLVQQYRTNSSTTIVASEAETNWYHCDDVFREKGAISPAYLQIKCPPPPSQ